MGWVGQGQSLLLHRQAGDLSLWHSLPQAFIERWHKDLPERLLYRAKCLPHSWGHPLHKSPLLMEGLLQSLIGRLRVLMGDPCQKFH